MLIGGHYKAISFFDSIDYQVIENSQQVKNTESRNGIN